MNDAPDQPFGHATVQIPAIFVPSDERGALGPVSPELLGAQLGYDAPNLPAVMVPDDWDGPRPGYPYVEFGKAAFPQADGGAGAAASWQHAGGAMQDADLSHAGRSQRESADNPLDDKMPPPPVPSLAHAQIDPVKSALRALNGAVVVAMSFARKKHPEAG